MIPSEHIDQTEKQKSYENEKSLKKPRKKLKRFIGTTAILGIVGGTAYLADRYDVSSKIHDILGYTKQEIHETVSSAYEGSISSITGMGSLENRLNIAHEIFKGLPEDTKMQAIKGFYADLDQDHKTELIAGAIDDIYGRLGIPQNNQLPSEEYAEIREGTLQERILGTMTPHARAKLAGDALNGIEEGSRYDVLLDAIVDMRADTLKMLYIEGSKNFTGNDYVEIVSVMSHLSSERYDNQSEIVKVVIMQSADRLAEKFNSYFQEKFKRE